MYGLRTENPRVGGSIPPLGITFSPNNPNVYNSHSLCGFFDYTFLIVRDVLVNSMNASGELTLWTNWTAARRHRAKCIRLFASVTIRHSRRANRSSCQRPAGRITHWLDRGWHPLHRRTCR